MSSKPDSANEEATRFVIAQALRLSDSQRLRVVAELLESLEGLPDAVANADWLAESDSRMDRVRRGELRGAPWPLVGDELLTDLRK